MNIKVLLCLVSFLTAAGMQGAAILTYSKRYLSQSSSRSLSSSTGSQAASSFGAPLPVSLQHHTASYLAGDYQKSNGRTVDYLQNLFKSRKFKLGYDAIVGAVGVSADGRTVVIGSLSRSPEIHTCVAGKWICAHTVQPEKAPSVGISADGLTVVTKSSFDYSTHIHRCIAGKWTNVNTIEPQGVGKEMLGVGISADGRTVVTGGAIQVHKCETAVGHIWKTLYRPHWIQGAGLIGNTGLTVGVSADGLTIAVADIDGKAHVYKSVTGKVWKKVHTIDFANRVLSVGISGDGNTVVAGSWDATAQIHNCVAGKWSLAHRIQHASEVFSVAVSGDGTTVVTGTQDGTVQIDRCGAAGWNKVDTITCGHRVNSLSANADSTTVVIGLVVGAAGAVIIYEEGLPQELINQVRDGMNKDPRLAFALHEVVLKRVLTPQMEEIIRENLSEKVIKFLKKRRYTHTTPAVPAPTSSSTSSSMLTSGGSLRSVISASSSSSSTSVSSFSSSSSSTST